MNPIGKKFISLFLVFSLMILSVNLYAKERRGAKLTITKKDGQQIEGELITLKSNSLLLLNNEGKDVSIDIEDIEVIRIMKKSNVGKGALIGFISVGVIILGFGLILFPWLEDASFGDVFRITAIYGGIGALLGAILGALYKESKKIQIEGMTDLKIQKILDYLRKKSRIRNYK